MPEYCGHCQRVTESRSVSHDSGVEWLCVECGAQVDFDFIEWDEDDDDIVGSCDECGGNIYEQEDDGTGLCDQCSWYHHMSMGDEDGWEMVG